MEVLLVTADFPPMLGGQAKYLGEVWGRLPAGQVLVLAPSHGQRPYFPVAMVRIWLPLGNHIFSKILKVLLLCIHCLVLCKRLKPRLLCAGQVTAGGIAVWLVFRLLGIPYVTIVHGGDVLGWRGPRSWLGSVLRNSRLIICNSSYSRSVVVSKLGNGYHGKIEVLNPPLPDSFGVPLPDREISRARLGWSRHEIVLLTVARLVPRKGIDRILEALPSLLRKHPQTRYVVVGDGPMRESLESRVRSLELQDKVRLEGFMDEERIVEYYAASDIFVLVSDTSEVDAEGFGVVYLEAQAMGLPVVAGNTGGAPEAVKEGETAFLVSSQKIEQIQDALDVLIQDRSRRGEMGAKGKIWVRENFDSKEQASRLWNLLQGIG
ncbi:MAG: glycosyltransferase family 4 protein [Elusimicrobia bacterium]|nr:glycosyltransferase family 4 protein [Elusimicrobiota bacterium]